MPDVDVQYSWNVYLRQWDLMLRINTVYLVASVPEKDEMIDSRAIYRKFVQMIEKWQKMQGSNDERPSC